MDTKLHNQIMRRVYYSFAISITTHTMFWRGLFLGAAALLLAQWLHVASIIHNLLATPVGNTPQYVVNSFVNAATHGELLTALILVVSVLVGVSCLWRITKALAAAGLKMQRMQTN